MQTCHRNGIFATLIGLAAFTAPAQAADDGFSHSSWQHNAMPSMTRWGDTYAGAVAAVSFRHGTYFYINRDAQPDFKPQEKRRAARILDARDARCSLEAGVCVIRP